jgi:ribosome assembly protein YihI (activator of Der GTPase)
VVNQDRDDALDEAIDRFDNMIEELGIEGAIETVISLAAC